MSFFSLFKSKNKVDLSSKNRWNLINCKMEIDNSPYNGPQLIGNNFYIGAALCPHCNGPMFKTVFPVGKEYKISTAKGEIEVKRAFTCVSCKTFLAPVPGHRVSEGILFEKQLLTNEEYKDTLTHMDNCGSLKGRNDL